jgi:predicted house-cleaning noncanonical NTP pyrophosphatase (MazG superfamily)
MEECFLFGMFISASHCFSQESVMRKFKQNKLWRDNAIEMMEQNYGSKIHWRRLKDTEFYDKIRMKLLEETQEVVEAKDRKELVSELADLYEIIDAIAELHQISKEEIIVVQTNKHQERGGFLGRKFVDTAEHPVGSFGEKYCLADPEKYPEIKEMD